MNRNAVQAVTLPVLVEVERLKEADGRANFLPGELAETSVVRIVKEADIKERLRVIFPPKEVPLFVGLIQLKQAFDAGDEMVLEQASQKVRPWIADFVELKDKKWEIAPGITGELRGMNRYSAFLNYSRLIADVFQGARLVMWFSEKHGRFLPSVYCPDWRTAAFVMTFLGRIRVCPKCTTPFIPLADNVDYCTPAHREAHRVARARWRARKQAGKKKDKALKI